MNTYTPDTWVVLEFTTPTETLQKVFAGWYGGFAGSDSWKLNSGITKTRRIGDWWEFDGYSGSVYRCHPHNYHMSGLMHSILARWLKQADERDDVKIRILDLAEVVES
jgi:hypothetical protein